MDWLTPQIQLLLATAVTIGVLHTVMGPDHYVPFIALGKLRGWSTRRTLAVTAVCGAGHCAGSILIGVVGVALGVSLAGLEALEAFRGKAAAWLLLGFGLAIMAWGLKTIWRGHPHSHPHVHADGTRHDHHHHHGADHLHPHPPPAQGRTLFWSLFVVFAFGPCEALIPMMMYPAAAANHAGLLCVILAFSVATIGTMVVLVGMGSRLLQPVRSNRVSRYAGPATGLAISLCAVVMLAGF